MTFAWDIVCALDSTFVLFFRRELFLGKLGLNFGEEGFFHFLHLSVFLALNLRGDWTLVRIISWGSFLLLFWLSGSFCFQKTTKMCIPGRVRAIICCSRGEVR